MKKRTLKLIMSGLMIAMMGGALAGCGDSGSDASTGSAGSSSSNGNKEVTFIFDEDDAFDTSSKNIPVVLIIICDVLLLKQGFIPTWYPTKSPKFWFISYDSLFAMETVVGRQA